MSITPSTANLFPKCTGDGMCIRNEQLILILRTYAGRKTDLPCQYNCKKVNCPKCNNKVTKYHLNISGMNMCMSCYNNEKKEVVDTDFNKTISK